MGICDLYPLQTHLLEKHLKRARRRYVSMPRVASGSSPGSGEEHQGCSVHRKQTNHGDTELSKGRQMIGYGDQVSTTNLQRVYT